MAAAVIPQLDYARFSKNGEIFLAAGVVIILFVMLVPLPTFFLDFMLCISISISLLVLVTTMFMTSPLEFTIFPSLLLVTTLLRLALNVASTRLILLNGNMGANAAGEVIRAFGQFVVGGSYVVGAVIFMILFILNKTVITAGTTRIAEVAARFTLDAMPGKQMAIEADLNAGLLDEEQANARRAALRKEADFYGAMDGACKFVSGDVNAGMFITLVNLVGGIIIGMVQKDMDWNTALTTYSLLTIGDGLVSTIPSIIVSTGTGLLVSRAASEAKMGEEFLAQLTFNSRALKMVSAVLLLFALVPGLPTIPFLCISALIFVVSRLTENKDQEAANKAKEDKKKKSGSGPPTRRKKCRPCCRSILLSLKWVTASSPWWTKNRAATCWPASAPYADSSRWTWAWSSPRCTCAITFSSSPASTLCLSRAIRWLRQKFWSITFWPWIPAT